MHPVHVATKGVDLPVVRDVAIWMRTLPARKSIGRESLVNQAESTDCVRIGKLAVEILDLWCEQKSLVNDRAARKRRDVEHLRVFNARLADLVLRALAHDVEFTLEGIFIRARRAADKYLLNVRLRRTSHAANSRSVHR